MIIEISKERERERELKFELLTLLGWLYIEFIDNKFVTCAMHGIIEKWNW